MPPLLPKRSSLLMALAAIGLFAPLAQAQSVVLTGIIGSKALISVDGGNPVLLAPNARYRQIELLGINPSRHAVTLRIEGQERELRLGGSPAAIGAKFNGGEIPPPDGAADPQGAAAKNSATATKNAKGLYQIDGYINGQQVDFILDPDMSDVTISLDLARRLDLTRLLRGEQATVNTADGNVAGERITVAQFKMGEIEFQNVPVVVVPNLRDAAIGNSLLRYFKSQMVNDHLILERMQ